MNASDILAQPHRLDGLGVALVTPLTREGSPDLQALAALTRRLVQSGVEVLFPLGTTGEGALLTPHWRAQVLATVLDEASGRPVIAGAGAIATEDAVAQTVAAREVGAHGVLVVTPPYVKPTPSGLLTHYAAVAEIGLPVVAYVVPGRTGLAVNAATQIKILELPGVVALKEASGNMILMSQVAEAAARLGKALLVGDDALALPGIAVGAHGLVSVAGHLIPRSLAHIVASARAGRLDEARLTHQRVLEFCEAMFWESNPIPVKQALALRGEIHARWRAPLAPPEDATVLRLRLLLERLDLLHAPFAGDRAAAIPGCKNGEAAARTDAQRLGAAPGAETGAASGLAAGTARGTGPSGAAGASANRAAGAHRNRGAAA